MDGRKNERRGGVRDGGEWKGSELDKMASPCTDHVDILIVCVCQLGRVNFTLFACFKYL